MSRLYDRRIAVTVGSLKVEGDHGPTGQRVAGLRIHFRVNQTLDGANNTADVAIYNLNDNSRGLLMDLRRPQFIIEAGYPDTSAAVFKGTAQLVLNKRASPGFITEVSASDGGEEGKRIVNAALAPGASIATVLETIATKMKVNAQRALTQARAGKFSGAFATFFNGYALSGSGKVEMDRLARSLGVRWTIQNGELIMLGAEDTTEEEAVLLTAETGMIGSPERLLDKKRPSKLLFKVRSLMQPKLHPGRRVEIFSKEINGRFRVEQALHQGDTHGEDWHTECVAIEVRP